MINMLDKLGTRKKLDLCAFWHVFIVQFNKLIKIN